MRQVVFNRKQFLKRLFETYRRLEDNMAWKICWWAAAVESEGKCTRLDHWSLDHWLCCWTQLPIPQAHVDENHDGDIKRLIAAPTLEGLCFTSRNLASLARRLLLDGRLDYLGLHSFTQDVLEAFFGNVVWQISRVTRYNLHLEIYLANHAFKLLSFLASAWSTLLKPRHQPGRCCYPTYNCKKMHKKIKGSNTTYGKNNAWTELNNEPLLKRQKPC